MRNKIVISGLAQSDDPAGGLGVARAVKAAYPACHIVGLDYSVRAAAFHDIVFDDVVIKRPWGEFETDDLVGDIQSFLEDGFLVIPTIDLEAYWMARHFPDRPEILAPSSAVFDAVAKPVGSWPRFAGLGMPETVSYEFGAAAMHAFGRRYGWRVWLKGPFHDALFVRSWEELDGAVARLRKYWPFRGLHLQAHVDGTAESVAFAAYQGCLLDALWIVKNDVTSEGKTVAGSPRAMADEDRRALADYLRALGWTGGGEIELIRDRHDVPWLVEINPRFPSWVDGGRLLGVNLPGQLIEAATGVPHRRPEAHRGFVRVQQEIPVRQAFALLEPIHIEPGEPLDAAKTAFSIHEIAEHLSATVGLPTPGAGRESFDRQPSAWPAGLGSVAPAASTPHTHFLADQLDARLTALGAGAEAASDRVAVRLAYSVKTNPDGRVLEAVRRAGLGAEVISEAEWQTVLHHGFAAPDLIVNGPGKCIDFIDEVVSHGGLWIADSLDELRRGLPRLHGRTDGSAAFGVRVVPRGLPSRFGMGIDDVDQADPLLDLLARSAPGHRLTLHMHLPYALIGRTAWRNYARALLEFGESIQADCGACLTGIDLGAGFYPDDAAEVLDWIGREFVPEALHALPDLETVLLEPGRAAVQDAYALETTVLEVRDFARGRDLVVDASLGELPEARHYPHRICVRRGKDIKMLSDSGTDRILGRTCMEDDVLSDSLDAGHCQAGDCLVILDAGSYDRSMAYEFGRG